MSEPAEDEVAVPTAEPNNVEVVTGVVEGMGDVEVPEAAV